MADESQQQQQQQQQQQPTATAGAPREIPEFYRDLDNDEVLRKIKDFDYAPNFHALQQKAADWRSRNFIIDFGADDAWCGFDLSEDALKSMVTPRRPPECHTRWINIWVPHHQKNLLRVLAEQYDFSPRLYGLMRSDPMRSRKKKPASKTSSSIFSRSLHRHANLQQQNGNASLKVPTFNSASTDPEDQDGTEMTEQAPPDPETRQDLSHYNLVDEVWHWSSVDEGRQYVCLGYNSLYRVDASPGSAVHSKNDSRHARQDLPKGKRIWSWLVLCKDKTIISINEDPFPYAHGDLDACDKATLQSIRRNLLNVFRNVSKAYDVTASAAIAILPIRYRIGATDAETAHSSSDSPGLLFYYLFDDWFTTYSLVARREHQYAAQLNALREAMLHKAELGHIDRLHHIGRQLAVLKRMYEAYEIMIDRVLEKQEATLASLKNSRIIMSAAEADDDDDDEPAATRHNSVAVPEDESLLGVALSSAARNRFKRLKYRTRLYALSEIQECLDMKESLVMMNFNLIAIKESLSVERLTRITLLLAKVTILFMPVSLMTAYFSTQLVDVQWTYQDFWLWFVVVLVLSVLALVVFSFVSGTLEGRMLYVPLNRQIVLTARSLWRRGRRRQKGE
ncbi:hypothetical protein K490DRAFT_39089 [Saccharata proteae CBS 121410]|uniref:ADP-ribosylation factor n=1 Tax=Saccharata proteae CBS 121410 TaxID=1314787 RepID=A0A6A5YC76_9PEZI|nr:hypothetical protein K490DRAFT_39089 [Saccharata proteae CBS 121410]